MARPTLSRTLLLWMTALLVPSAAPSQDLPGAGSAVVDPPAHIAFVDGAAVLERDGRSDPAPTNMPLLAGDRVRTQNGRVEILFGDGSVLHLDFTTTVDFQSDELIRLLDGRLRLAIPGPARRVSYRVDAPSASADITQPGEYRVAILHSERADEVELAVLRGAAELVNGNGRTPLRAGERAFSRADAAPSYAYVFNSAAWDGFDRWSEGRRDQRLAVSTQYLPDEVRPYASSFDRYGDWRYEASYGYVWYPTVSVGWRPYYNGRWVTLPPYGWTWVGADPWGWPTHHYGRWGFSASAWFWIPGRTWAPSWVSWAYAPGYVSWCPLGWNNRPVVQFLSVNVRARGYDPWRAWTVAPRHHFGAGDVNVRRVAVGIVDNRARASFVARNSPPEFQGRAVPRSAAPIRAAGTETRAASRESRASIGVPRPGAGVPVYTNHDPGQSRGAAPRIMVGPSRSPADVRAESPSRVPSTGVPNRTPSAETRPMPRATDPYSRDDRSPSRPSTSQDDRAYVRGSVNGVERRIPVAPAEVTRPTPRGADAAPPIYRSDIGRRPPSGVDNDVRSPGEVRAVPRAAPDSAPPPPPPGYRESPGVERRAPEASRPSGPPGGGVRSAPPSAPSGGEARPRSGGQPASGTAAPRRGRGHP